MTCPRGRPRWGAPWKPHRPSVSPSNSPSICSSPCLQSELFSASSHVPMNSHFNCMAMVPKSPSSPLRHLLNPLVNPTAPTPVLDPLGNLGCKPPPHHASRGAGQQFTHSFNAVQFRDSLATLHDLVFGIRQGAEDLHYRLQDTNAKVEIFLWTLSSMQDALSSSLGITDPMEEPGADTGEGQDDAQCSAKRDREKFGRESNADETTGDVKAGKLWADQMTYVEEEPWIEDLHAKWPDYSPVEALTTNEFGCECWWRVPCYVVAGHQHCTGSLKKRALAKQRFLHKVLCLFVLLCVILFLRRLYSQRLRD